MNHSPVVLIASDSFRGHHYGRNHPLGIPRVALTLDLINVYGPLGPEVHLEAREATVEELIRFHHPDYVAALRVCQQQGRIGPGMRQQFNIGNFENPYFDGVFTIPALATGASIQGAERVLEGGMAFNPAGGMHHAMPGKARGFCYFNDAVLGIMHLRQAGLRVLYWDLDAHHGDGVQYAFEDDPDVMTVSYHMDTDYAYPRRGGGIADVGRCDTAVNLPLPPSLNDSEYRLAFQCLWPEILARYQPDAVVLQTGTDMLCHDPLGKWRISNRLFLEVVAQIKDSAPRHPNGVPCLLVLGGGGYQPVALARCWTGVWGVLADWELPASIPEQGRRMLESVQWSDGDDPECLGADNLTHSRLDDPMEGPIRQDIKARLDTLRQTHPLFVGHSRQF